MSQFQELNKIGERQHLINDAESNFINRIGRPQPHFNGELGKLHQVEVKTTIHHQSSPGSTNYHTNKLFDGALSRIIAKHFTQLSEEALILLQADLDADRKAMKDDLEEALEKLEGM